MLDEAIQRQEKVVQEGFPARVRTEEEMDRLVRILLQRAEILRLTDRKKEAEAVMRHIDQWQAKLGSELHLDDQMQARIVQLVKDTTGKLLCLKYRTKNAPEARETLSETLTHYAFSELVGIPWYPKDSNSVRAYAADSNAPDAVNCEFDQISATSPDNMGFLTVHAQGCSRLATREVPVSEGHFAFVYKVKLPENSREKMVMADVTEADSGASEGKLPAGADRVSSFADEHYALAANARFAPQLGSGPISCPHSSSARVLFLSCASRSGLRKRPPPYSL